MSFSYSAGVITQSGTDTDLSGLSGLTGVTTWTSDPDIALWGQNYYVIDASTRLDVTGTLTIEPDYECLIFEGAPINNTTTNPLIITGTLNLGVKKTSGSKVGYSQSTGLMFTDKGTNAFFWFCVYLANGATLNWNGGVIRTASTLRFEDGSNLNINNGVYLNSANADYQLRLTPTSTAGGANLNINDISLDGRTNPTLFFTSWGFNNAVFELKRGAVQQWNGNNPEQSYRNFNNVNNLSSNDFIFTNNISTRGGNFIFNNVGVRLSCDLGGSKNGYIKTFKEVDLSPVDLAGSGISYSYYGVDIDNGNRTIGPNNSGTDGDGQSVDQDDTADIVYSAINQTGAYADSLLIETLANINGVGTADDRTISDTIPIKFVGYNESITTWASNLIGLETLTEDVIMTPDLSITEATKAIVDAYTTIETPEKFYDRAKSYLFDNFGTYQSLLVSRSGDLIDAGSYNVDIDATAGSAFAFDGSKITIKANRFTGDITTTGTFNLLNSAEVTGTVASSNQNFTTISVTFSNLTDATIEVFDNTGTSVDRVTAQTGSYIYYTPSTATGTWSYVIDRIGYIPKSESFNPSGSNIIVDGALVQLLRADGSVMYTAETSADVAVVFDFVTPCMCIEIGDAQVDAQVIFDEAEQSLVTVDGMRWQNTYGTLTRYDDLPGVGRILFLQDDIRLKRALAGDVNSGVTGYVQSTQGTPIDGTNGSVAIVAGFAASDVWSVAARTLTAGTKDAEIDAIKTKTDQLNFTGSDVQSIASNMRGTDSANTIAPDNAGITANGNAIAALNDVAATDIVSAGAITTLAGAVVNVDLVDTCTTNTDQRGTDGANTIAPDNAGITANGNAISSLNDFDPVTDAVANVTLVATTTTNTDMRGTDGANTVAPDNTTITANATNIEELRANQVTANEGIKKSSLIIPYSEDLPNT